MPYRGKVASLIAAIAILIAGGAALAAQESVYREITEEVAQIRELELLEPLDLDIQSREQLQQWVQEMLEEDPLSEREMNERALAVFGFIEPGTDTAEMESEILGEQIAGFYDPETKSMVVVRSGDGEGLSPNDEVTFAHEVVHALQDQHFDLMEVQGDLEAASDDEYLAVTALIEGDASVAQVLYLVERPLLLLQVEAELAQLESPALDTAPLIFSETLIFPYDQGSTFVLALYEQGGWDAVNAAYNHPPTTTEQILHPEKYEAGEGAMDVTVSDPSPQLGSDWSVIDDNEMGEFVTDVFLRNGGASDDDAQRASEGWGGDAYVVVGNETETAFTWVAAWDSEQDAEEFLSILIRTEAGRLDAEVETYDDNRLVRITGDEYVGEIRIDGNTVTYSLAESEETLEIFTSVAEEPAEAGIGN